jgi:hypothetical protein
MVGWQWIINAKGWGRKRSWPNLRHCLPFTWGDWGRWRNPSVRIVGVPAEIRTGCLSNWRQKRYRFSQLARTRGSALYQCRGNFGLYCQRHGCKYVSMLPSDSQSPSPRMNIRTGVRGSHFYRKPSKKFLIEFMLYTFFHCLVMVVIC